MCVLVTSLPEMPPFAAETSVIALHTDGVDRVLALNGGCSPDLSQLENFPPFYRGGN